MRCARGRFQPESAALVPDARGGARADQINEAYERMLKGDVKYRFVIDNASLAA